MKKRVMIGGLILATQILGIASAVAGPWEDGTAAYNRGDYVPAVRLFRLLAEQGNAKAQNMLGVMYRRGQGVPRNSGPAFLGFNRPPAGGDPTEKGDLAGVSQPMTGGEIAKAAQRAGAGE